MLKEKRRHKRMLRQSVAKAKSVEQILEAIKIAYQQGGLSDTYIAIILDIDVLALHRFCSSIRSDKETFLFHFPKYIQ